MEPNLGTIPGKAQGVHQIIKVSRFALSEIDRTSSPYLGNPNIQWTGAIGKKRYKPSVRRHGRIALHALKVGQPCEFRIGDRIRFGSRWAVCHPSGYPTGR